MRLATSIRNGPTASFCFTGVPGTTHTVLRNAPLDHGSVLYADSRCTSVGAKMTDRVRESGPSSCASSSRAISAAMSSTGCRTVVNGGRLASAALLSSKPTTMRPSPDVLNTRPLRQWKAENPVVDDMPTISWLDED